jgi:2-polyprenyl-6-methoxyphenol hydroxylase-like FAD-dependent oxidoreductase
MLIAGVLLDGMSIPMDVAVDFQSFGKVALFFPQGDDRVRAYYAWNKDLRATRIQGAGNLPHLIDACVEIGVPKEWLAGARAVGPLATFDGADCFVPHPHRDGVVLVGDAAASSDPTYGQGLALTLRDVRVLRDALLANDDWRAASDDYAREHDRYYANLRTYESWFSQLFYDLGDAADALRGRVLPRLVMDPTILPPTLFVGPDAPHDEAMRARLFGD